MDANDEVKLTLSGRVQFEHTIDPLRAAEIIKYVLSDVAPPPRGNGGAPTSQTPPPLGAAPTTLSRGRTPRQVLDESEAKRNPDKITAFAANLLDEGVENFTVDMVKPLFKQAREAAPANFTRDLDKAILAGWVAAGSGGEFYVTEKGLTAVSSKFSEPRPKVTARRATAPRKKEVPEVVAALPNGLPATLAGALDYVDVKKKRDKALWVLALLAEVGIDSVPNSLVTWVSYHFGDGLPSSDINAHYRGLNSAKLANRDIAGNMRITKAGQDYLAAMTETG